jgi:hypothetical protein
MWMFGTEHFRSNQDLKVSFAASLILWNFMFFGELNGIRALFNGRTGSIFDGWLVTKFFPNDSY